MNMLIPLGRGIRIFAFVLASGLLGCDAERSSRRNVEPDGTAPATTTARQPEKGLAAGNAADPAEEPGETPIKEPPLPAGAKRVPLGKNIWLETAGKRRRVIVNAVVCLREGQWGLECLLCRKNTKEHESLLSMDADARILHTALTAAGAEPGKPVQFDPKFAPPTGSKIKVTLQYKDEDGKRVTVPAQQWVRDSKTKKDLEYTWVFAGSMLWQDPDEPHKPPLYLANGEGAIITISNVATAVLDLPINSPKGLEERSFVPHTKRIPEIGTTVSVLLEAVPPEEKK